MIDSRKIIRDTEITLLIAAAIILLFIFVSRLDTINTYDYDSLSNCMAEWNASIKAGEFDDGFYEDACNALKKQVQ